MVRRIGDGIGDRRIRRETETKKWNGRLLIIER